MGFSIFFYDSDFSFPRQTSLSLSSSSSLKRNPIGYWEILKGGGGQFDLDAKEHSPSSLHFVQSNEMMHHLTAIPRLLIGKWDGWRERGKRGRMEFHVFGRRKQFAKGYKGRKQFSGFTRYSKAKFHLFSFPVLTEEKNISSRCHAPTLRSSVSVSLFSPPPFCTLATKTKSQSSRGRKRRRKRRKQEHTLLKNLRRVCRKIKKITFDPRTWTFKKDNFDPQQQHQQQLFPFYELMAFQDLYDERPRSKVLTCVHVLAMGGGGGSPSIPSPPVIPCRWAAGIVACIGRMQRKVRYRLFTSSCWVFEKEGWRIWNYHIL